MPISGNSRLCLLLLLPLLLAACETKENLRSFCSGDADCPPGYRCDPTTGLCLCATDEVCQPDEFCAPDGRCRKQMSCDTNQDCPEDMFCDSENGQCIEMGKCTRDEQCPLGQICNATRGACQEGCRDSGDCPLGEVCSEDFCQSGLCESNDFCAYGQLCDMEDRSCYDDQRGPFCAYCKSATIYEPQQCGAGPNFCLVKGGDLSLPPYCGVDCSQGQACPSGYACFSVRIVYTRDNCRSNEECDSGVCHVKEGDDLGFCLCSADEQCPQDSCDDFLAECRITRRSCTPDSNDCDKKVRCIDGYCHIGYNCKPLEGLRCEDILP